MKDEQDVIALCHLGADAVLIGVMLMRAPDKQAKLKKLRLACSCVSDDEKRSLKRKTNDGLEFFVFETC